MKTIWNNEQLQCLRDNYATRGSIYCEKILPFSRIQIHTKANKIGLHVNAEIRSKIQAIIASRPRPDLCKVNTEKFTSPSTKEAAYALGMLWADGYLNNKSQHYRISLELIKTDFDEILPIFNMLGSWTVLYRHREGRHPQGTLMASNRAIYEFLKDKGYETKSVSSAHLILEKIPKELTPYWWRGYFDGDGCLYSKKQTTQLSFAGSYEQDWTFAETLCESLNISYRIKRRIQEKSKDSIVQCTNRIDISTFGKYIYSVNDNIGLNRKRQKFINAGLCDGQQDASSSETSIF